MTTTTTVVTITTLWLLLLLLSSIRMSPTCLWFSWASPLAIWVLLVATHCTLGPPGRHPTYPFSFRALSHAPLVVISADLHQWTQLSPVCSGDHREIKLMWSRTKNSSCEIWIEKEKQKRRLTVSTLLNHFPTYLPPVDCCVPSSHQATTEQAWER